MQDLMVKLTILIPEREMEFSDILGRSFRNFSYSGGLLQGQEFYWDYLQGLAESLDEDFLLDHFIPLVCEYWDWNRDNRRVVDVLRLVPGEVSFCSIHDISDHSDAEALLSISYDSFSPLSDREGVLKALRPTNREEWFEEAAARRKIRISDRFDYQTSLPVKFACETGAYAYDRHGFYYDDTEAFVLTKIKYS